jgi:hypothetical protein
MQIKLFVEVDCVFGLKIYINEKKENERNRKTFLSNPSILAQASFKDYFRL